MLVTDVIPKLKIKRVKKLPDVFKKLLEVFRDLVLELWGRAFFPDKFLNQDIIVKSVGGWNPDFSLAGF